jgi:hypothetical protein
MSWDNVLQCPVLSYLSYVLRYLSPIMVNSHPHASGKFREQLLNGSLATPPWQVAASDPSLLHGKRYDCAYF